MNYYAVVLAAGQGTRMKSSLYKVLHPVCGKPMVQHVVDQVSKLGISKLVTVVGHGAEMVKTLLGEQTDYALQQDQLGTAHAVQQAEHILGDKEGVTIVLCGDTPLVTHETLEFLLNHHENTGAKATILTAHADDPTGYGRIIRNEYGSVERIVEHKDASAKERAISEINTGTYCFDNQALFQTLAKVSNDNVQGEYYLPDVIGILKANGEVISAYQTPSFEETLGVNNRVQLAQAESYMRRRINIHHMLNGVTIIDPEHTFISADSMIGQDTVIYPGTVLAGKVIIGTECTIGPNSEIKDCEIGSHTEIRHSVAHDSKIGQSVKIGPFAHIRPASDIHNNVKIGNFVEIKKSVFDEGSKASHLSYIGDAEVGKM